MYFSIKRIAVKNYHALPEIASFEHVEMWIHTLSIRLIYS